MEPQDIADAVLILASDDSPTITGSHRTVDHGATKI
ncbi:SDR family oxidoreductase [Rhodococcus sp. B50]|nr:SDR family oxidoreductase [Rhodococcus sp. B50]